MRPIPLRPQCTTPPTQHLRRLRSWQGRTTLNVETRCAEPPLRWMDLFGGAQAAAAWTPSQQEQRRPAALRRARVEPRWPAVDAHRYGAVQHGADHRSWPMLVFATGAAAPRLRRPERRVRKHRADLRGAVRSAPPDLGGRRGRVLHAVPACQSDRSRACVRAWLLVLTSCIFNNKIRTVHTLVSLFYISCVSLLCDHGTWNVHVPSLEHEYTNGVQPSWASLIASMVNCLDPDTPARVPLSTITMTYIDQLEPRDKIKSADDFHCAHVAVCM